MDFIKENKFKKNGSCLLLFITIAEVLLMGCARPQQSKSASVRLQIPTAQKYLSSSTKVSALSDSTIDYNLLCFAVNVRGADIDSAAAGTCNVERGIFSDSVGPGGSLIVEVPSGEGRSFEIYGFLRSSASDLCPTGIQTDWRWPLRKIYFLGRTDGVTINPPEASVDVVIDLPNISQNLIVAKNWPSSCGSAGALPIGRTLGRVQTSAQILKGNTYRIYSRISDKAQLKNQEGNKFQVRNWKASTE